MDQVSPDFPPSLNFCIVYSLIAGILSSTDVINKQALGPIMGTNRRLLKASGGGNGDDFKIREFYSETRSIIGDLSLLSILAGTCGSKEETKCINTIKYKLIKF